MSTAFPRHFQNVKTWYSLFPVSERITVYVTEGCSEVGLEDSDGLWTALL